MNDLVKPAALEKGSTIGIVAPSSPFLTAKFERGIEVLKALGFDVRFDERIFSRRGYLAGSDEERAKSLNDMIRDEKVHAIMFARGGYGVQRIMSAIDFETLKRSPKIVVGYSDLTALTSFITTHLQITSIHGPVVTALSFDDDLTSGSLANILTSNRPLGEISGQKWTVIKEGKATGRFFGGCLTLISSSVGTPYQLVTSDTILFIEDLSERVYKYDRMLTQLKNSGALRGVRGIVFGPLGLDSSETNPSALWSMIEELFKDFEGPIVAGMKSGHIEPFFSLPLGCACSLDTKSGEKNQIRLIFKEAALS